MKTLRLTFIILIVLSLSSCKFFKQQKWFSKDVDTLLTAEQPIVEPVPDSTQIQTIVQETEPITSPIASGETTYGYGNDKFYMVVGSFLSEQLANKYAKKMQEAGYQPQIIYSNSSGFYRVSAKSYNDFTSAVNDISNFRDNVTPRAWVHVKKK
jgi:cell division protein FtsN